MADSGREERIEGLLQRGVDALEKLASDPVVEYESGPPICPHCGKFDPVIHMDANEEMSGPLSEVILTGDCTGCGHTLYAVVESYSMHRTRDTVIAEVIARKERAEDENSGTDQS